MATFTMSCSSWTTGTIQVTYDSFAGGIKITKIEGKRGSARSYLPAAQSFSAYVNSGYTTTFAINNPNVGIVFGNGSYENWKISSPIYIHGSGSITWYIQLPTGSVAWSGKLFSGSVTLPAYTGPSVASASAASNATGAITYSGSGSQGTQLLPSLLTASGYTQVNYVTASGNTWVDTGIKAKSTTRIDCAFQYSSSTLQQRVFGTGVDDVSGQLSVHLYINGSGSVAWAYQNTKGNWTSLNTQRDTKVHTIKMDAQNNTVVFDGQSRTMGTTRSNTSTDNIALFGRSNGSNYMTGNIYCCRIYEGGTLVRDFVPAKRNSDSVYGLYDVKNNAFYTGKVNALSGTTSFNSPYVWNVNGNINAMSGTKTGLSQNTAYTCTFTVRDVLGLTASWSQSVTTKGSWTVSYAANGGTSTPSSQTKNYNVNLTLAAAISKNNTSQNGYTVTFKPNGGSTTKTSQTASDTVKWTFSSWKATNGTTYSASGTYSANESTTMTAQWTSSISARGSVTTPTTSQCTRTYYTLLGWSTSSTATTQSYNPGASYTPDQTRDLYAVWKVNAPSAASISITYTTRTQAYVSVSYTGAGLTGYTVYYRANSTGSYSSVSLGTSSTGTITGLSPNTSYQFYVKATNATGNVDSSTTTASTKMYTPMVNTPTYSNVTSNSATVGVSGSGDTNAAITNYTLYWKENPGITKNLYDMPLKVLSSDNSLWARIFYHNCKEGTTLFSTIAECKNTQTTDKYSRMSLLEDDTYKINGKFEFMLCYPANDYSHYNRWKQTNAPQNEFVTTTSTGDGTATGYEAVHIDWASEYWGGLTRQNSDATSTNSTWLSGSVGHGNWFYAVGAFSPWNYGIPASSDLGISSTYACVELWIRIGTLSSVSSRALGTSTSTSLTSLNADSDYLIWVEATNARGPGYGGSTVFHTAVGIKQIDYKVNGTWKKGGVYIKVNGSWIPADDVFIKVPDGSVTYYLSYIDSNGNTNSTSFSNFSDLQTYISTSNLIFTDLEMWEEQGGVWKSAIN